MAHGSGRAGAVTAWLRLIETSCATLSSPEPSACSFVTNPTHDSVFGVYPGEGEDSVLSRLAGKGLRLQQPNNR
ncbi:hypothetical protein Micbo1qcDRAFT_163621 [Microdochium bolleyi]|uniref:Uncharacterized protein n=1 Tax=Microdochium bolleyi TaxID=196109 RepID=A0A136J1M7_9PEZI|nr:hypothetical protein Micbo1qcDRAFT_163621 [Microdochium bolleyi]